MTDGMVNAIAIGPDGTTYLGGRFEWVAAASGSGVPYGVETGLPLASFARVTPSIAAIVADGAGGWFIGGSFDFVGGLPRRGLAHLLADGTVDEAWRADVDRSVIALALEGDTLYVGGLFTVIGGASRSHLAAVAATSGGVTSWDPGVDLFGWVAALATNRGTVYVGGQFTAAGGAPRSHLAALDATTGEATPWAPEPDAAVSAIAFAGGTVYVGGSFAHIAGEARNRIAAVDAMTGALASWNPDAQPDAYGTTVRALAVSGDTVFVGGEFSSIGGAPRAGAAALDSTGAATPWDPQVRDALGTPGFVHALAVKDGAVYVGGVFARIGDVPRANVAAVDAATGAARPWNPSPHGGVGALAVSGGVLYVGGSFASMGGVARKNVAALHATTGVPTDWAPEADAPVMALVARGETVFAGGLFSSIGGKARSRIAALDAVTGAATWWDPSVTPDPRRRMDLVYALAVDGGTVYLGGNFVGVGGEHRHCLAAVDATTGTVNPWNPGGCSEAFRGVLGVSAIAASGSTVYVGGQFTSLGGRRRMNLAAVDAATGEVTDWDPGATGYDVMRVEVGALAIGEGTVYAGGTFETIGGEARAGLAALDAATGAATSWNPAPSRDPSDRSAPEVSALLVIGSTVYAGGSFDRIGGGARRNLAALDATTGLATPWVADADAPVSALALGGDTIRVGGSFSAVAGQPLRGYAELRR